MYVNKKKIMIVDRIFIEISVKLLFQLQNWSLNTYSKIFAIESRYKKCKITRPS